MGFFTKKIEIKSPIKGKLIDITDVKDEAFSSKALGDGMAIIPADGKVCSPIDGEVVTMIDTNHAIGLETKGVEILIHIGMDTVKLEGKHFKSNVKEGYKIKFIDKTIVYHRIRRNTIIDEKFIRSKAEVLKRILGKFGACIYLNLILLGL